MRPRTTWPRGPRTVFFDDIASPPTRRSAIERGEIRPVASGIWSTDLITPAEDLVSSNIWRIVGRFLPGALIVDRSAALWRPDDGIVTVATDLRARTIELPGVAIVVRPADPDVSDLPWTDGLMVTAPPRTIVDNLALSRGRGRAARTLALSELQDHLARRLLALDVDRARRLRDETVEYARRRGHDDRLDEIDRLFDEASGERPPREGSGEFLRAALAGRAWDEVRLSRFAVVADQLSGLVSDGTIPPTPLPPPPDDGELPFYEAYFSNYIEGTEFSVEDAREIVETDTPPAQRSEDGHDILGTYHLTVDPVGRAVVPADADHLLELLTVRHDRILKGRPDKAPGTFKDRANQVGSITFVEPAMAEGTLRRSLALIEQVPPGFARALLMMFIVTEVHPFTDGNGRVARLMMNAELSATGTCRIVVPTVIRNEYLSALRRATGGDDVTALVKVLAHTWRWTSLMPWADRAATEGLMQATNALVDSTDAAIHHLQLEIP